MTKLLISIFGPNYRTTVAGLAEKILLGVAGYTALNPHAFDYLTPEKYHPMLAVIIAFIGGLAGCVRDANAKDKQVAGTPDVKEVGEATPAPS